MSPEQSPQNMALSNCWSISPQSMLPSIGTRLCGNLVVGSCIFACPNKNSVRHDFGSFSRELFTVNPVSSVSGTPTIAHVPKA